MPISLPKEVQTRKLSSLDGDLRKIAESLIADKFDIKEEVVEKIPRPSFPEGDYLDDGRIARPVCRCGPEYAARCSIHGDTRDKRPYGFPRTSSGDRRISMRTTDVSERGILDLMRRFDEKNVPRHSRRLHMGREEMRKLAHDCLPLIAQSVNHHTYTLFGMEIMMIGMYSGFVEIIYSPDI